MRNNSWQLKTTLHKNSWRLATNKPSMMRTRFIFCSHGLTQEQSVKCINLLYTQCTIGFEFGWNISVAVFKDWCSSTQQSWPSVMVMVLWIYWTVNWDKSSRYFVYIWICLSPFSRKKHQICPHHKNTNSSFKKIVKWLFKTTTVQWMSGWRFIKLHQNKNEFMSTKNGPPQTFKCNINV